MRWRRSSSPDAPEPELAAYILGLIALGSHDTSEEVIAWAPARFGKRFRRVAVGQAIVIQRGTEIAGVATLKFAICT